jgi:hypothetical protein
MPDEPKNLTAEECAANIKYIQRWLDHMCANAELVMHDEASGDPWRIPRKRLDNLLHTIAELRAEVETALQMLRSLGVVRNKPLLETTREVGSVFCSMMRQLTGKEAPDA